MCDQKMEVKNSDISNNADTGQKYDRIVYVCKKDDAWVTTEIPQDNDK